MSKTQDVFGPIPTTVLNKPLFHAQHQEASGVNGGNPATATGWSTRPLNTVLTNEISGASLSSNAVSLPAGEYHIEAICTCHSGGTTGWKLAGSIAVDGSRVLRGGSTNFGYGGPHTVNVSGKVILHEPGDVTIDLYTSNTSGNQTWGIDAASGDPNVYADLRIWRLDRDQAKEITDPTLTLSRPLFHAQDQKALGTNGGSAVVGDQQRDLNSVLTNEITGASLAANEINLPAGEFYIEASAVVFAADGYKLYVKDSADTTLLAGENTLIGAGAQYAAIPGEVKGRITLAVPTTIKLVQWIQTARATNGLGVASSQGTHETYSDIRIWQQDAVKETEAVYADTTPLTKPKLHLQQRYPTNTLSQTLNSGWTDLEQTLQLNEIIGAGHDGSTLTTLPAGEYWVSQRSTSTIGSADRGKLVITDESDQILLQGALHGQSTTADTNMNHLEGKLILPKTTVIKCRVKTNDNGQLGSPANLDLDECYVDTLFTKLDTTLEVQRWSDPDGAIRQPLLHVQDQKPSGTTGGASSVGYNDRDLNAVLTNEIPGASLAANEITLPAGEYWVDANASTWSAGDLRTTIRDTGGTELLRSQNWFGRDTTVGGFSAPVQGRIVLSGTTTIKLSTHHQTAYSPEGLGLAKSDGVNEIYADVRIWAIDSVIQAPIVGHGPVVGPTGTIVMWPTNTAPTDYLLCNGQAVDRTDFSGLFAVIGTNYGNGDGSTTFNLPDFRGMFVRGSDNGAGVDPEAASRTDRGDGVTGDVVGTKQADEVGPHTHVTGLQTGVNSPNGSNRRSATEGACQENTGLETRPVNIGMNYIIKT